MLRPSNAEGNVDGSLLNFIDSMLYESRKCNSLLKHLQSCVIILVPLSMDDTQPYLRKKRAS